MRYLGNKASIAKYIKPILEQHRTNDNFYFEPFVGAAGMMANIDWPPFPWDARKVGYDSDPFIVALLKAIQDGWEPPSTISEQEYVNIRNSAKTATDLALVGFVGYGCSYGGKWFGGLARGGVRADGSPRNHVDESRRNLLRLAPQIQDVEFVVADYRDPSEFYNYGGNVIYLDPPYGYSDNVTKYKNNFDSAEFFRYARLMSKDNYVYVSEYSAPDDFIEVWSKSHKSGIHHSDTHKQTIERLFTWNKGLVNEKS